jgi:hypothetical protein
MADFIAVTGEVLALAGELAGCAREPAQLGHDQAMAAKLESLAGRLRGHHAAAVAGALDSERIRSGVMAARAALELEVAMCAVADGAARATESGRAAAILAHMAYLQALAALAILGRGAAPADDVAAQPVLDGAGATQSRGAIAGAKPGAGADLGVLKEVSYIHRQHARYHSLHKYENAHEIGRDSHRLKALADLWMKGGGPKPRTDIDFTDPRYRAAPCSDLNVPDAIPNIGFLFLEGFGKPPELTLFEARLQALAEDIGEFGASLLRSMDAAWVRESALFAPDRVSIAWTRLMVVISNWRSAHDSVLAAALLTRGRDTMVKLDLTPAGVRARLRETGKELSSVSWVLDIAAQLCAAAGVGLADNNWRYTQYSEFLEGASPRA